MKIRIEHWLIDTDRENPKDSRKPFPSATLSTTVVTRTGPGPNPVLRGERPRASGNGCGSQPE